MAFSLRRLDYGAAATGAAFERLIAEATAALEADGAVIVERLLSPQQCEGICSEMEPYLAATPSGESDLKASRRSGALVARSPSSHAAMGHPVFMALSQRVLGEQGRAGTEVQLLGRPRGKGRYPWRLSYTEMIDLWPSQQVTPVPQAPRRSGCPPTALRPAHPIPPCRTQKQSFHRGNGSWVHNFAGLELELQVRPFLPLATLCLETNRPALAQLESLWATKPFTVENGATHIIPVRAPTSLRISAALSLPHRHRSAALLALTGRGGRAVATGEPSLEGRRQPQRGDAWLAG